MQATTVAAQGEAETNFNLAGFTVSLSSLAQTVPSSKAKLKNKVDDLMSALTKLQTDLSLTFVKNSVRSSSNVQEKHEWVKQTQEFKGYETSYHYSFQIDDMEKVNQVYDVLTSLPEVKVASPAFGLKNRDKLNKKALKHAFEKVQDRFDAECAVLGLSSADFEIVSWETHYSDSQRSQRVSAATVGAARRMAAAPEAALASFASDASGGSAPLDLVTGLASVTVNLEVGYARKAATQTLKATVVKESPNSSEPTPGKPKYVKEIDNV
jgi:uncharacterized protein YggE